MLAILKEKFNISYLELLVIDGEVYDSKMGNLFFNLNPMSGAFTMKKEKLQLGFPNKD